MQRPKQLVRDFSNYSEPTFLNELSQIDLIGAVGNEANVSKAYSVFNNKINALLNKHTPLKSLSKRRLVRFISNGT